MKRIVKITPLVLVLIIAVNSVMAASAKDILKRVKAAEAGVRDMKAEMVITQANKSNVAEMGDGYTDILRLEKAVISYKKPNMIRYDGYARGIKAALIQNGYKKLILAAMIRKTEDDRNAPGKRQDTLDLGFLSSQLWVDNNVSIVSVGKNGTLKMKFDPKAGGTDKRHDMVWIDSRTLKILKREKYRGNGELRLRLVYSGFQTLGGKLPIATESTLYNPSGEKMGSVKYKNVKSNVGLPNSLFSLSQR